MSYKRALNPARRLVPGSTLTRRRYVVKPTSTGPDEVTLLLVQQRAYRYGRGVCCEGCGALLFGDRGWGWSVHHRQPRGMGGTRRPEANTPPWLLVLCGSATTPGSCHQRAESHRTDAIAGGWLVPRGLDPTTVAVLIDRGSRWVYLGADGEYLTGPIGGAE